jgi:hypothetical protein
MRTVLTAAVLLLVIDGGVAAAQRWNPPPAISAVPPDGEPAISADPAIT